MPPSRRLRGRPRPSVLRGAVEASDAARALGVWARLGPRRVGVSGLLVRIWQLRDDLTAYDATYGAVAEAVEAPLVTADARFARARGRRCTITAVRRRPVPPPGPAPGVTSAVSTLCAQAASAVTTKTG